ncbi:hypothetical protein [Microbispora triticiradicis]|uniref:Uncharacterized protein n=3 Tax=Microbispora TaxID=2005 RepID=A0ABY3LXM8_9ACTN|nr:MULTISPECIES: hypothetical protein [Microbispora]RGA02279.1 hypothetical protein DI270_025085 [Microbispora triticiradicis]TLP56365.1 hypothetical protein FED44_23945 [Microbispora fusca]TYB58983.1 hypothetical protein FXF59_15420 [Microbispora tritici]GLW24282.1 hypothetical protein Mame01_43250 [Microbispora amethystogenes]
MLGGAPRTVWFIWPADPHGVSARSVAQRLIHLRRPSHLVWNPVTGEIVQLLPPTLAGGALAADRGRNGRVCVQIHVIGSAREPFTDTKLDGLDDILAWLDSWGVPRRWPAGPPLPYPHSLAAERSRRLWARGGHFGHSQVPGTREGDPGSIDIARIIGEDAPGLEDALPRGGLRLLQEV